jgi:BirA family biotin operon repressor/biotin-[acetyl-CoA-carboxylase] ligase
VNEVPVPFAVPERLQVVDSTNRYLVDLARAGLPDGSEVPEGYAVTAERQSEGRGRLTRRWEAPYGSSVLCSILFKPALQPEQLHLTAWAVALAAVQACREAAGVDLTLKWPNDLLSAERKVGGVLSQTVPPASVVVGIGINVNWPPHWPPPDSDDPELAAIAVRATSLNRVAGREISRRELAGRLVREAGRRNAALRSDEGRRALASEYRRVCATIGRDVRVELQDETVTGRALDVDDLGRLLVVTDARTRAISAGDVVHLR